jgi:Tol biopolymer transport system component
MAKLLNSKISKKLCLALSLMLGLIACSKDKSTEPDKTVPHEGRWGIYQFILDSEETILIYSSDSSISNIHINDASDRFVFSMKIDGTQNENEEICMIDFDGDGFSRITHNEFWDLYPCWSPDGTEIAFLTWRDDDLDIYVMDADGSNADSLYDSGSHDADIDWIGDTIVFTTHSQIWRINSDGTQPTQLTDPPNAGEWGDANLPFGDYDPRLSPDGSQIVFERLEDDASIHGNYNLFVINSDGTGETRLTDSGYSQGTARWSYAGDKLVYIVAAINDAGKYDIYLMNADGTDVRNITPDYFPANFLCYSPLFWPNDQIIYFVGEWWE